MEQSSLPSVNHTVFYGEGSGYYIDDGCVYDIDDYGYEGIVDNNDDSDEFSCESCEKSYYD